MWYFTWIIGIFAAVSMGVINVMWYEAQDGYKPDRPENAPKD